ncbi:N-acetyltransferase GCN5 [Caballeronia choica]|uniref:N-acetyltransferase GCN5 n=1 Tax=Caballeronia choica TaxID=326476 RepID=A0A158FVJ8_9BURK|nr:acetate--CoA ligase family protein [Caballeronia choica]SAL23379.1 N-acetyltransferase GCN5 [Caballeronia choica]
MSVFPSLERLVEPRSVVIVGASSREGSQGHRLVMNVLEHSRFAGDVHLVNPSGLSICGRPCWPSIDAVPAGDIDVALVIVNASRVMEALRQCAARGIPFAIVMSSGFAEADEAGKALEAEIADLCRATGLRVYGPNCPGFVNVRDRIGLTFSPAFKDDLNGGAIGLATQGGGLGRNVLQSLSYGEGVGLWFSAGNEVDLGVPDFIAHMATDPRISVIAVLMEGIKDGRKLIDALKLARENAKPVVILKVGRSELGVRAAQSHTASIAGSAAVNSAVFRQYGAIEVDDLSELAAVSKLCLRARTLGGDGVCVLSFSGGACALAADAVGAAQLPMASLHEQTTAALREVLPAFASVANPVDTTADIMRDSAMTSACLRTLCEEPNVGAVLFPIPMDYGDITGAMASAIVEASRTSKAVVVPVWMSRRMGKGFQMLESNGLQPFLSVTEAVRALKKVHDWRAGQISACAAQTPAAHGDTGVSGGAEVGQGQMVGATPALTEVDAKRLLGRHGIVVPSGELTMSAAAAAETATRIGFPCVMKVVSPDIAHKTEAGGVRLNLETAADARTAYDEIVANAGRYRPDAIVEGVLVERMLPPGGREMLVGVHRDEAFGPVLTVGLGGILVEVLKDVSHRVIPVDHADARRMIAELRHSDLLGAVRGQPPADVEALAALLVQVSEFVERAHGAIDQLDINPVWVGALGEGAIALDALMVLAQGADANAL